VKSKFRILKEKFEQLSIGNAETGLAEALCFWPLSPYPPGAILMS
jgi:hypothetical protein